MMEIGILAYTFERPSLESMLDAVVAAGLKAVQYHIFINGIEVLPESYPESFCDRSPTHSGRAALPFTQYPGFST